MAKVNDLGWTSGITMRVMGERIGVRVNDSRLTKQLKSLAFHQSWDLDTSKEPVDLLYSLRIAPPAKRSGTKHFHLLYAQAKRITRTLRAEEIWSDLGVSVWEMAALLSRHEVLLKASLREYSGGQVLMMGGEVEDYVPVSPDGLAYSRVPITHLFFRDSQTSGNRALSSGECVLNLMSNGLSQPARALVSYSRLASRVSAHVVGTDWRPENLNRLVGSRKKDNKTGVL